jgi:hypothetical protein
LQEFHVKDDAAHNLRQSKTIMSNDFGMAKTALSRRIELIILGVSIYVFFCVLCLLHLSFFVSLAVSEV